MTTFIEVVFCLQWSRDRREASGPSSVIKVLNNTSFCGGLWETFSEVLNANRLSLSTHNVLYLVLKCLFKVFCLLEEICTLYRVLVFLQKKNLACVFLGVLLNVIIWCCPYWALVHKHHLFQFCGKVSLFSSNTVVRDVTWSWA